MEILSIRMWVTSHIQALFNIVFNLLVQFEVLTICYEDSRIVRLQNFYFILEFFFSVKLVTELKIIDKLLAKLFFIMAFKALF